MNGVMKSLVSQLLDNELSAAKRTAKIFPSGYGSQLLGEDGLLTDFGIDDALQYPFPQKLGKYLASAMGDVNIAYQIETEFAAYNKVFKLIDPESKRLSPFAIIKAIHSKNLKDQCLALGWPLTRMTAQHSDARKWWSPDFKRELSPEELVMISVTSGGGECSWCEGASVNLMLKATTLEAIVRNSINDGRGREDAINRFFEAHLTIMKDEKVNLINCAKKITDSEFKKNIAVICSSASIKEYYPRVREEFLYSIYEHIPVDMRIRMLEIYMDNPYGYRAGWPDLMVLNNGVISFIEVKTKDRFLDSQLRFAIQVAAPLGLKCQVIQVVPES